MLVVNFGNFPVFWFFLTDFYLFWGGFIGLLISLNTYMSWRVVDRGVGELLQVCEHLVDGVRSESLCWQCGDAAVAVGENVIFFVFFEL